jgi:hypothetical protein
VFKVQALAFVFRHRALYAVNASFCVIQALNAILPMNPKGWTLKRLPRPAIVFYRQAPIDVDLQRSVDRVTLTSTHNNSPPDFSS